MTSPDNCFDEMAKVLFPHETSEDVGYIRLLEEVKRIKNIPDENKKLKNKLITANKKLKELKNKVEELGILGLLDEERYKDRCPGDLAALVKMIDELKKENEELKKKIDEIPSLLEDERYKERCCNERDYEDYEENADELQEEIDELKKENEELKETYFQKGFDAGKEEYEVDKEFLNEKDEEIKELKEQIAKQERWSRAKTEVNMFLSLQWKELITSQDLSQMSGLGKDLGTDIAIVDIAEKFVKHEQENKKLKEQHEDTLDEVREYLGRFNGDEVQVFDKIVKNNSN